MKIKNNEIDFLTRRNEIIRFDKMIPKYEWLRGDLRPLSHYKYFDNKVFSNYIIESIFPYVILAGISMICYSLSYSYRI